MATTSKKKAPETKPKTTRAKKEVVAPVEVVYVSPFSAGDKVTHPSFGDGKVTEVNKNQLSIAFDDSSTKVILDGFVTRRKS